MTRQSNLQRMRRHLMLSFQWLSPWAEVFSKNSSIFDNKCILTTKRCQRKDHLIPGKIFFTCLSSLSAHRINAKQENPMPDGRKREGVFALMIHQGTRKWRHLHWRWRFQSKIFWALTWTTYFFCVVCLIIFGKALLPRTQTSNLHRRQPVLAPR